MTQHAARPTFRTAGFFREGYDSAQVDDFVDRVFTAIATATPVPDILTARFTTTRRGGYDMDEVDSFLDEVAADLQGPPPGLAGGGPGT